MKGWYANVVLQCEKKVEVSDKLSDAMDQLENMEVNGKNRIE